MWYRVLDLNQRSSNYEPDEDDRSHIDKLFSGPPAPKKSSSGGVALSSIRALRGS